MYNISEYTITTISPCASILILKYYAKFHGICPNLEKPFITFLILIKSKIMFSLKKHQWNIRRHGKQEMIWSRLRLELRTFVFPGLASLPILTTNVTISSFLSITYVPWESWKLFSFICHLLAVIFVWDCKDLII